MTTVVQTQRLRLREFTATDLDQLANMVADEEQMAFYHRALVLKRRTYF